MPTITEELSIPGNEIELRFIRAGGPGGQHVNKASTAVQLRFDISRSPSLPDAVKKRLRKLAGNRVSDDGLLTIEASRFRSQKQNREDAIFRFVELVKRATQKPKKRRPTKPSKAATERRLEEKKRRSRTKRDRSERYS